ncbi:hypothetical protein [Dyadobacter sp. 676]|uniref:DUF4421 domain-containing protein n=1 Tax=Dyadobacter sp. 676 TaxID=3088362 RepID=A0AAU8FJ67_9BACT
MKVKLLAVCVLGSVWGPASAQDSLAVSFSEETDTLMKQHFVDRYENVFMTKVPTKHILKTDMTSSEMSGKGIYLGYEYKPLPFLSVEAGLFAQASNFDPNRWDETIIFQLNNPSLWASGRLRWYYNMNRRIRSGLSANNFTGSYAGINYDHPISLDYFHPNHNAMLGRLGLIIGHQGRFLQNGHFDFSIGMFNRQIGSEMRIGQSRQFFKLAELTFGTQISLGFALGDWKKQKRVQICDILVCDERIKSHWKLLFPDISVGLRYQRALAAVMYETQISKSPFSVQFQLEGNFWNQTNYGPVSRLTLIPGIQFRSYFLKKRQIRNGSGGSSLSGLYAALAGNYTRFDVRGIATTGPNYEFRNRYHDECEYADIGVKIGYQQRLFGRLFIDVSYGYSWHFPVRQKLQTRSSIKGGNYPAAYDAFNVSTGIGLTL